MSCNLSVDFHWVGKDASLTQKQTSAFYTKTKNHYNLKTKTQTKGERKKTNKKPCYDLVALKNNIFL